jgi:hypothetical protein
MYLLTLEASPYRRFYENMGGQVIGVKQVEIEGVIYDGVVYGWHSLRRPLKMRVDLTTACT